MVEIAEQAAYWQVTWPDGVRVTALTASDALDTVLTRWRSTRSKVGDPLPPLRIHWQATTEKGRRCIKSLTPPVRTQRLSDLKG